MAKSNRIRFANIEQKYDVKMDYFDQISFIVNEYEKDRYVKIEEDKYIQVHRKKKCGKNNKTINEDKKFSSIKNKLSEYWSNGLEIDIDKTFVSGNKYKNLYIILM